eukprot:TRINITY_DN46346_c0_g1_i1.p1 TRINITY_DN46346_c0_g1~~TRINITY_DN46346_c0_g1_i1.p1  ORF type:complete len:551 (+),score=176.56 TRINITY_DN46346_c0_g1_i1:71-1654(+)
MLSLSGVARAVCSAAAASAAGGLCWVLARRRRQQLARIIVLAGGTRGDTQPMLRVAAALQQLGCTVDLWCGAESVLLARAAGLSVAGVLHSATPLHHPDQHRDPRVRAALQAARDARGPHADAAAGRRAAAAMQELMDHKLQQIEADARAVWFSTRAGERPAAVVGSVPSLPLLATLHYDGGLRVGAGATRTSLPTFALFLQPWAPSRAFPPCAAPAPAAAAEEAPGAAWERAAELHARSFWRSCRPQLLAAAGEGTTAAELPEAAFLDIVRGRHSIRALYLSSCALLAPRAELKAGGYPAELHVGSVAPRPDETVPAELRRFVEASASAGGKRRAVVCVGFGSMVGTQELGAEQRTLLLYALRALRLAESRAVLHTGWARLRLSALHRGDPEEAELLEWAERNAHLAPELPHSWLLPQCACIVHHGGAGTANAALRAGCPQVVTPFAFDQGWHADRLAHAGVGIRVPGAPTDPSSDPADLAAAIRRAAADGAMRRRCEELAARERDGDGAQRAAQAVLSAAVAPRG